MTDRVDLCRQREMHEMLHALAQRAMVAQTGPPHVSRCEFPTTYAGADAILGRRDSRQLVTKALEAAQTLVHAGDALCALSDTAKDDGDFTAALDDVREYLAQLKEACLFVSATGS